MNIPEIIKEHHQAMIDKGFHDIKSRGITEYNHITELLTMIIGELCGEAVEAHRTLCFANCDIDDYEIMLTGENYKHWFERHVKNTFEDEIADVFLRLFDLCGYLNIKCDNLTPSVGNYNGYSVCERFLLVTDAVVDYWKNRKNNTRILYTLSLLLNISNSLEIPIEKHILAKMAYNKTRPHKHGKEY